MLNNIKFQLIQRDKNLYIAKVMMPYRKGGHKIVSYEIETTDDGDMLLANCEDAQLGDAIDAIAREIVRLNS